MNRLLTVVTLFAVAICSVKLPAQAQLRPYAVPSAILNGIYVQDYPINYHAKNQSVWFPGQGGFNFDQTITLEDFGISLPSFSYGIGGYFDTFIAGEFGFFFGATISADPFLSVHAGASLGTIDLDYPGDVFIDYPLPENIHPGGTIQIQTFFYPQRTAVMNVKGPRLDIKVDAGIDASIKAHLNAEAFSEDIVDIDLFKLVGLDDPTFNQTVNLVDTDVLGSLHGTIPIIPNIVTVDYKFPNLSGTSHFSGGSKLRAYVQDDFLTVTADITNAILSVFALPPLNGDFGNSDFGGSFHLLDTKAIAGVGVAQDIIFEPRPMVTLTTDDGQSVTVRAGDTATLRMPEFASLTIYPSISTNNHFSNDTGLTLTPTLDFDLIGIGAHGSVEGVDLGSFDWHPFHKRLTPDDPWFFEIGKPEFEIPTVNTVPGTKYVVQNPRLQQLLSMSAADFKVVQTSDQSKPITGQLVGSVGAGAMLQINGQDAAPVSVDPNGAFSTFIPRQYLTQPGTLTLQVVTHGVDLPITSNPVSLYVQPHPISSQSFVQFKATQPGGSVDFPDSPFLTAGAGPISLYAKTAPFVHTGVQVADIPEGTRFYYGGQSVDTTIVPTMTVDNRGQEPVYTTFYELKAVVPESLQVQGGAQDITIVGPGVNAPESAVATALVQNAQPTVSTFASMKKSCKHHDDDDDDDDHDGDDKVRRGVVIGTGFTKDSVVTWDGSPRKTNFISGTTLDVKLHGSDMDRSGPHAVGVTNPAPGGGSSNSFTWTVQPVSNPQLQVSHSLLRDKANNIVDIVKLQNSGLGTIQSISIDAVNMEKGGAARTPLSISPTTVVGTQPGGTNSVLVIFPADAAKSGMTVTLRIKLTADGQSITIKKDVVVP